MNTRAAVGGTLIRRYTLAPAPAGAGIEAAITAASVPPLSGGPGSHGSHAAHAFTITDSVAEPAASPLRLRTLRSIECDNLCHDHGDKASPDSLSRSDPAQVSTSRVRQGKASGDAMAVCLHDLLIP
jgi:hypothetical protein